MYRSHALLVPCADSKPSPNPLQADSALENLINEAALLAGRERKDAVDMALLESARDKIVLGAERDQAIGDDERRLVARWGISQRIGPVAFRRGDEPVFLGRDMAQTQDFSDAIAKLIDDEIRQLIEEIEGRSRKLMEEHRDRLERLVETVLDRESLDRAAIDEILSERPKTAEIRRIAGAGR